MNNFATEVTTAENTIRLFMLYKGVGQMKKISAFLLSAFLLALFTFIPVSAATNGYPDKSEFFDKSEYSEVLEVVSGADIFNKNEKIDEKIASHAHHCGAFLHGYLVVVRHAHGYFFEGVVCLEML